jgi:CBS domain-containing protein
MYQAMRAGKYNWMKVVDVMTESPVTVTPADTVGHAEALMSEHGFRQLPVVQGRALVGVITDRDIRSILCDAPQAEPEGTAMSPQTPVGEVMSAAPVTLSPHDDLQTVVTVLIDEKFGGFPVVDNDAGLLGIVTHIDLLRCFLSRLQEN